MRRATVCDHVTKSLGLNSHGLYIWRCYRRAIGQLNRLLDGEYGVVTRGRDQLFSSVV